ncbi:hypothetical protein ACO0R3_002742 [Hanseniaspora guilliermondii]
MNKLYVEEVEDPDFRIPDKIFVSICKFDELTVRYLVFVLDILTSIIDKSKPVARTIKHDIVETKVSNNPAFMSAICLTRIVNKSSLHNLSFIFNTSKTTVSNIDKCVVNNIFIHFSHLININNCCYDKKYLKLLVDESKTQLLPGVVENTTHMTDGTHTKITKPTKEN